MTRPRQHLWFAQTLLAALAASPAVAAPGQVTVTVERLAGQAKAALEAADFDRATELYLGAWRQDQTQIILVFNAARAQHLARHFERAALLYQDFARRAGPGDPLVAKAQGYLADVRLGQAEERADEATRLGRMGRYAESAAAWRSAFRLAPSRTSYLLQAARAARLTADLAAAAGDYQAYLKVAPPGPDRDDAETELALLAQGHPPPPAPRPSVAVAAPVTATHAEPTETGGVSAAQLAELALQADEMAQLGSAMDAIASHDDAVCTQTP